MHHHSFIKWLLAFVEMMKDGLFFFFLKLKKDNTRVEEGDKRKIGPLLKH